MANQQFDERLLRNVSAMYDIAASAEILYWVNGTENGVRVDNAWAANLDSIDHTLVWGLGAFGLLYPIASVTLPAAVGGKPSTVELIASVFPAGQGCIVQGDYGLFGYLTEVVLSNTTPVTVVAFGGKL